MRLRPWQNEEQKHDVDDGEVVRNGRDDGRRRWRRDRPDADHTASRTADRDAGVGDEDAGVGDEVVETERSAPVRWDLPALLAAATGVALIVIGVLALVRSGIDGTWYQPVVEVAGISHTPLLGAIEIGVGVLLVLAAMAGVRVLAALVALAAGVAAVVVAIEPGAVERELAIETEWAVALAVGLLAVGLLILSLGREGQRRERRVERRPVRRVRTG
jgi:hypothetical protein